MANSSTRVALATTPTGAPSYPLAQLTPSVATGVPLTTQSIATQSVLGSYSGLREVALDAMSAGDTVDIPFATALSTFPSPLSFTRGASGRIIPMVSLATLPYDVLVTTPALTLSVASSSRSGVWTLVSGVTYGIPIVHTSVRVYAPISVAAQTLVFLVEALLVGVSSS